MPISTTVLEKGLGGAAKARRAARIAERAAEVTAEKAPSAARRAFPDTVRDARNVVGRRHFDPSMPRPRQPRFGGLSPMRARNFNRPINAVRPGARAAATAAAEPAAAAAEAVVKSKKNDWMNSDMANKYLGKAGTKRRQITMGSIYAGGGLMAASAGMNAVLGPRAPRQLSNPGYQPYMGGGGGGMY